MAQLAVWHDGKDVWVARWDGQQHGLHGVDGVHGVGVMWGTGGMEGMGHTNGVDGFVAWSASGHA